ncbi:hypothetical protein B0T92_07940 [Salmonella enterica]|nr:hypothetical protein [Salmonella enterica]
MHEFYVNYELIFTGGFASLRGGNIARRAEGVTTFDRVSQKECCVKQKHIIADIPDRSPPFTRQLDTMG